MREIPSLQTLCLRSVGGKACSGEETFALQDETQHHGSLISSSSSSRLSSASKLLRAYYRDDNKPFITRIPAIGRGSARRKQANDVDLNHPWVAVLLRNEVNENANANENEDKNENENENEGDNDKENNITAAYDNTNTKRSTVLYAEHNTPALDVLQSYIDSLVELSRFDDARLGLHFFQEWKANVIAKDPVWAEQYYKEQEAKSIAAAAASSTPRPSKRRRSSKGAANATATASSPATPSMVSLTDTTAPPPLGSLSLYNTIIQDETIQAMVESNMTYHLAVLDWTGVQTLTDDYLQEIVTRAPHLQRLSVKNCRRLTQISLECLSDHLGPSLTALDIGGAYQFQASHVIEMVAALPKLTELHASGLLWTDALLADLCSMRSWTALSLGFLLPQHVTSNGLKQALVGTSQQAATLKSLALPFCEHIVDAALLGVLGRHLPNVVCLDVRGNSGLNSLTGWYDGRATIHEPRMVGPQPLFVLARYSGISKANVEDTKRIHPLQAMDLVCCMDSDGVGMGIRRYETIQK